jgi:CMP-N,N'-diacetyllegionaminic acid synthase
MAYIAFVPARSGSKRLPGKNIKMLAGKPLVVHTLEAFVKAEKVDKVIFSTDSEEYWQLVREYISSDKLVLEHRSSEHAGDNVKIFDYLKNNHNIIFKKHSKDVFLMGLPTVPLRNESHVNKAIQMFEETMKPVFSAAEYGFPISFAFYTNSEEDWKPFFDSSPMNTGNTRSQDQKKAFHPNGAIYVRSIKDLSDENLSSLYQNAKPFLMERIDSIDIDNEIDFILAEAILRQKQ